MAPLTWRARRLRATTGAAIGICVCGVVALRLGAPDAPTGIAVGVILAAVLATHATAMARRSGVTRAEAGIWWIGLLAAAAAPMVLAVFPGTPVVQGAVALEGDILSVGDGPAGRGLVMISADLPNPGSVALELGTGLESLQVGLARQARSWSIGGDRGHTHEDRTSLLISAAFPDGERRVVLQRTSRPGMPIRVAVFPERAPSWLIAALAGAWVLTFAWRIGRFGGSREVVMTAGLMLALGLTVGALATPERAVGAVLRGLFTGLFVGLPAGAALTAAMARLRRESARWNRAARRSKT